MRIAVIRNDIPAPLFIGDLESVSQRNTSVDAPGQVRRLAYPKVADIEAALASPITGAGAVVVGSDLSATLPITIDGTNNTLEVRTGSLTALVKTYTVPSAEYATVADLVVALVAPLAAVGDVVVSEGSSNNIILESTQRGVASVIQVAATGTAQTDLGLATTARTVPTAAAFLTGAGFPGGPVDASVGNLGSVGAGTSANALAAIPAPRGAYGLLEVLAPLFAPTFVAMESFFLGAIHGYSSPTFNPDTRNRLSTVGAAIAVLEDNGLTSFGIANTLPTITGAVDSAGALTISGNGLGTESGNSTDPLRSTIVGITGTNVRLVLEQERIEHVGGHVTNSEIYIPAGTLLPAAVVGLTVVVQNCKLRSNAFVVTL
jgi:hypothetical protein